ncbi:hypothetical protein MUK42_36871 [Musa troglodytarum]|uniref:Uncharacterized protein n=1 Tax=Musa troglodytarum TaxID=320322 RepID=A0A9E7FGR9_9LILI|nr:hypothetical protein MUK42_36871 [Musa troglodytarum]
MMMSQAVNLAEGVSSMNYQSAAGPLMFLKLRYPPVSQGTRSSESFLARVWKRFSSNTNSEMRSQRTGSKGPRGKRRRRQTSVLGVTKTALRGKGKRPGFKRMVGEGAQKKAAYESSSGLGSRDVSHLFLVFLCLHILFAEGTE